MSRIKRSFWQYIAEDEELTASEAIGNMKALFDEFTADADEFIAKQKRKQKEKQNEQQRATITTS